MMEKLDELYREVILEHYQRPARKGELPSPTVSVNGANPLCGDELAYQMKLDGGRIAQIRFAGKGCAISQAAASMLADELEGKTPEQARALIRSLKAMMQGQEPASPDELGELSALEGVRKFPVRVKCAALSWNVVEQALDSHEKAGK